MTSHVSLDGRPKAYHGVRATSIRQGRTKPAVTAATVTISGSMAAA